MIQGPYLLLAKIGVVGLLLLMLAWGAYRRGEKAVQADWDREKAVLASQQLQLVQQHNARMAELWERNQAVNKQVSQDYERKLDELNEKHASELERVRKSGGLRVPATVCSGSSPAAAKTTGDSGRNEGAAATVALPDQVTTNLFQLANEADQVTEQLRACQSWIRKNGFY